MMVNQNREVFVDYVKLLITGINVNILLDRTDLNFKCQISKTTAEINENEFTAEYGFCTIKIKNAKAVNPVVQFTGSIHKLHNHLNKVLAPNYSSSKPYNGYNGNSFTLKNLIDTRTHLERLFNCKSSQMIIQNIELGKNIKVGFKPKILLDGLLYHRNKIFEYGHNGNFAQAHHSYFSLKIYSKSYQYKMTENVLRIELKIKKMEELNRNGIGINTLQDIQEGTLNKASELLLQRFDEVVHYDYTIDISKLSKPQLKSIDNFSNPRYWLYKLAPNERDRHLKKLNSITVHSDNLMKESRSKLIEKCSMVNQTLESNVGIQNSKKCSTVNLHFKSPFCSIFNSLDYQLIIRQKHYKNEGVKKRREMLKNSTNKYASRILEREEIKQADPEPLLSYSEQKKIVDAHNIIAVAKYNLKYQ